MLKKLLAVCTLLFASLSWAAVDANKATEADLVQVKGIGPSIANTIVETRKSGQFKNWDDFIARVKGIGTTNAEKFSQSGLTIDGKSYRTTEAATATPPKESKK